MIHFILYRGDTGEILSTAGAQGMTEAEVSELWPREAGVSLLFVTEPLSDQAAVYVVDGEVVPKVLMSPAVSATTIQADGVDACVISDLPDPCMVKISGPAVEVTGGTIVIRTSQPGAIKVEVKADPTHKPWETSINAV